MMQLPFLGGILVVVFMISYDQTMGSKDINRSNLTHLFGFVFFKAPPLPILHTIHKAPVFCFAFFGHLGNTREYLRGFLLDPSQARWKEMGLEMDLFLGRFGTFGVEKKT